MQTDFVIKTHGQGLYEITEDIARWVHTQGGDGLLTLLIQHTSASLLIQENADPSVQSDLRAWLSKLVPPLTHPDMQYLRHRAEGPDDMPAHIKASLLPVSLQIPVTDGRLRLGTWQGIYVFEHRDHPHTRRIVAHLQHA
ncbi:MAG: YjbQ family protein [Rhodobacteraceae bacterium]|nr:YjbQ family protein [Paracoccaceae bacterium]